MNKFFRHCFFITSTLYAGFVFSVVSFDAQYIPQLEQQEQHAKVVKRVSDLYGRSHYKFIPLDDDLSQKIFERFIEQLDYNKQIFLQSDIDELKIHQFSFDESLKSGLVDPAYIIYQKNLKRRFERFNYAIALLNTEIKFESDEKYQFDRSDS